MRYLLLTALATAMVCGGCSRVSSIGDGGTDTDTDTDSDSDIDCNNGEYSGDFMISPQLDFSALSGYTSISGDLIIGSPFLTDLSELICLESVGGTLTIAVNPVLTNMNGLSALTSVGGDLVIGPMNDALTNLDGLGALTSVKRLFIDGNDVLPDCEVCDLLDQLTTVPTSILIHSNLDDTCTPVPDNCP